MLLKLIFLYFAALVFGFMVLFTVLAHRAKSRFAVILFKTLAMLPFTCVCVLLMVAWSHESYVVAYVVIPLVWILVFYAPEIIARIYHVLTTPPEED